MLASLSGIGQPWPCVDLMLLTLVRPLQGLDEPPSSNFHPIFNYVSSSDFYTDGKGWTSLTRVVTAKQASSTLVPHCPTHRLVLVTM